MIAAVLETISGYQSGTKVFSLAGISNCFVVGYIAIIFMMTLYIGMKGKKHFFVLYIYCDASSIQYIYNAFY